MSGNDRQESDDRVRAQDRSAKDERGESAFVEEKRERFKEVVEQKRRRKMKARNERGGDLWFGLGVFGLIGWSVTVPTLVGLALGIWIDTQWPGRFSWTIMLLFAGVAMGCLNAWYWITRQQRSIWEEEPGTGVGHGGNEEDNENE